MQAPAYIICSVKVNFLPIATLPTSQFTLCTFPPIGPGSRLQSIPRRLQRHYSQEDTAHRGFWTMPTDKGGC